MRTINNCNSRSCHAHTAAESRQCAILSGCKSVKAHEYHCATTPHHHYPLHHFSDPLSRTRNISLYRDPKALTSLIRSVQNIGDFVSSTCFYSSKKLKYAVQYAQLERLQKNVLFFLYIFLRIPNLSTMCTEFIKSLMITLDFRIVRG